MIAARVPFDQASDTVAGARRLWTAIGISIVVHALVVAAIRGVLPTVYSFADSGAGRLPPLQALLVAPPVPPEPETPAPTEPAIDPDLVVPPETKPVETTFGRARPAQASLAAGEPSSAAPGVPEINISIGMIADPARLGADYVTEIAQRFPHSAQRAPELLGAPVVDYPRAAIEKGLQGRFAALVSLDALGRVVDAKLVIDDPLFGPALLDSLKRMEFTPAQDGGSPIPYWAIVEFAFTIGKPEPSITHAAGRNRPGPQRQRGTSR